MAQDLNNYSCTARLTKDHDLRYSNSGMAICSFNIAVNRRKKQQDGTWQDIAMFFECSYFGKQAEGVANYLMKGQQVAINGTLDESLWPDKKTGQQRHSNKILVSSVTLIGSSNKQEGSQNQRQPQRQQSNGYQQQNQSQAQYAPRPARQVLKQPTVAPENFEDDSDVPF